jgi:surface polysaccharide O-acyltransferase-like enzyme
MKIRQSNFELLRIIAMLLIVTHHYSVHGGWVFPSGFEVHKFYAQSLSIGGKLGVNLFVLITGYFAYESKFKWNGIISTVSKTWFYSIVILLIFYIATPSTITAKMFIMNMLPFGYWFVTAYIVLLAISPFINIMLNKLTKKLHLKFLIIFTIISVTPLLNGPVGNLSFFIYLYCIGAYIKEYYEHINIPKSYILTAIVINIGLILLSIATLDYLSGINNIFNHPLYFIKSASPFIMFLTISIFIYFKQLNIGRNKYINLVSSSMFGVYLIHDNHFVRQFLWVDTFKNQDHLNTDLYIHSVISILSVFMVCILIELTKNKIFDIIHLNHLQNKISKWINKKYPI